MPKIDELPKAKELNGDEQIPVLQDGKTVRVTIKQLSIKDGDTPPDDEQEDKPDNSSIDGGFF
jgi:hypothetical protein